MHNDTTKQGTQSPAAPCSGRGCYRLFAHNGDDDWCFLRMDDDLGELQDYKNVWWFRFCPECGRDLHQNDARELHQNTGA